MSRRLLVIIFAVALIGFLAARAPLSVAGWLAGDGFSYSSAEGTLWNGVFRRVNVGGQFLGDMEVKARPLALLTLKFGAAVDFRGGDLEGVGVVERGPGGLVVKNARVRGDLRRLDTAGLAALPRAGLVVADIRRLSLGSKGCRAADANLWTDALAQDDPRWRWRGPPLTGDVACREGVLVLPLAGEADGEAISIVTEVASDFTYRVNANVATRNPDLAGVLTLLGFIPGDEAYEYQSDGVLDLAAFQS